MSMPIGYKTTPLRPSGRGKQAWTIWGAVALVGLVALVGTYLLFVKVPPPGKIVLAAGGKGGAYYQFAQKYAAELKKEGVTVEVRETEGSVENLQLLQDAGSG